MNLNLSNKFRVPITKTRYMYEASKVSSGFGYFFRIFALSICFDAELNSASNGPNFQRTILEKGGFCLALVVCLGKLYSSTCDGFLVGFVGCRIKVRIHQINQMVNTGRGTNFSWTNQHNKIINIVFWLKPPYSSKVIPLKL